MKRIGWLADSGHYEGGAEMAARELAQAAPAGVKVIPCPHDAMREDVDAYVVNNCTQYESGVLEYLKDKPTVKVQHDVWPYGDPAVRTWLLKHSKMVILGSPVQKDAMPWRIDAPHTFIPHSVNMRPFREAARRAGKREGVVWFGRLYKGKGLDEARAWAIEQGVTVDVYGYGPLAETLRAPLLYKGQLDYRAIPKTIARYETFLFLPTEAEPYNRATVEAYAAGCKLVLNENVGPLWWITHNPAAMEQAHTLVWKAIQEAVA